MNKKILLAEDEINSQEFIKNIISSETQGFEVVAVAESIEEAIAKIETFKPDILLLDIQLKDGLSFDIFKKISYKNYHTIFITSYDSYAIQAIKLAAVDYILKPLDINELVMALDRIKVRTLEESAPNPDFETIVQSGALFVQNNNQTVRLEFREILAFVADGTYTEILTKERRILSGYPLAHYIDLVPSYFFRSHRSNIINSKQVVSIASGRGGTCQLSNGAIMKVAVRKKAEFSSLVMGK